MSGVAPELPLQRLHYDLTFGARVPEPDEFLVSIGAKGFGTLYHIVTVRKVKSVKWRWRWMLGVVKASELLGELEPTSDPDYYQLRGARVHSIVWYPRPRKKRIP